MSTQPASQQLGSASIRWDGQRLSVNTGEVARTWALTGAGLVTVDLRHGQGANWVSDVAEGCDWHIWGFHHRDQQAELVEVAIVGPEQTAADKPLWRPHLRADFTFHYAETGLGLRYSVTVWPGAPGVRTQLALRLLRQMERGEYPYALEGSVVERLRLNSVGLERLAAGYYSDPQHRNRDDTPMLKQERHSGPVERREIYDWANLLGLRHESEDAEHPSGGLWLLKESHKCADQPGLDGGQFTVRPDEVRVTGLGLNNVPWQWYQGGAAKLLTQEFRQGWATWCVLYAGDEDAGELALKRYDRMRYNPRADRDLRIRANTWGTRPAGGAAFAACTEENMRVEIDSCADLGVDSVTIDDGWQHDPRGHQFNPPGPRPTRPHPERFPGGWGTIRDYAAAKGVTLGLHFPSNTALEDLIRNRDEGGFAEFKIDFGSYTNWETLHEVFERHDALVAHTDYDMRISWDTTENSPRVGYWLWREYGTLWLENRRAPFSMAAHNGYIPRLILRDAWHLSRYLNLTQVEIVFRDPEEFHTELGPVFSNAGEYPRGYLLAMTFMALPMLFMETHFLSEEARAEIKPLLALYRAHRRGIYEGYVLPIGDEPDDSGWTGFQSHNPETGSGYLTVFRELRNDEPRRALRLPFLAGQTLRLTDLVRDTSSVVTVAEDGSLPFEIPVAPDYRFMRYERV